MALRRSKATPSVSPSKERWISLGDGTAKLPERLLLAHARGEVLFITGAGTSIPAGLPDFEHLVVWAYEELDAAIHAVVRVEPSGVNRCAAWATQSVSVERCSSRPARA